MSNYRILNLTLATILTSAIPFLTANNIAIAQSTNHKQQPSVRSHNDQSRPQNTPITPSTLQTTPTTPSTPQISPENQRRLNEAASNAEKFNRINQQQTTIEPIYNPAFDVPSF